MYWKLVLSIFLVTSTLASAEVSSISDCSLAGWDTSRRISKDNLKIVRFTASKKCAAAFLIKPNDKKINDGFRSEMKDPNYSRAGTTVSYEFSTYIPASLKNVEKSRLVIAQWHDAKEEGVPLQRPPFSIRLVDGKIMFPLFNETIYRENPNGWGKNLATLQIPYGQWIRWKIQGTWSASYRGKLQVWMNGKKIIQHDGEIGYPGDVWAPYFKMGAYTTKPFSAPITIYHSEYRRTVLDR